MADFGWDHVQMKGEREGWAVFQFEFIAVGGGGRGHRAERELSFLIAWWRKLALSLLVSAPMAAG